jgi:hypothetical protein
VKESLSNKQWSERFNTKVDVGDAIGVTHHQKVLLEYVAQELHNQAIGDLSAVEQLLVRDEAEEHLVSYAFLSQSRTQHGKLNVDLQNDFTTGDNRYPKNRQQTLNLLDKYSKTLVARATPSESTSFAQRGGRRVAVVEQVKKSKTPTITVRSGGRTRNSTSVTRKDTHRPTAPRNRPRTTNDRSQASTASSVDKLKKDLKSMKKLFTTVNTQLAFLKEADSNISESE